MAKQPSSTQSDLPSSPAPSEVAPAATPHPESYRYTGPVTSFDMKGGGEKHLYPGVSYRDLPADDPIIMNLIERKVLVAETAQAVAGASSENA